MSKKGIETSKEGNYDTHITKTESKEVTLFVVNRLGEENGQVGENSKTLSYSGEIEDQIREMNMSPQPVSPRIKVDQNFTLESGEQGGGQAKEEEEEEEGETEESRYGQMELLSESVLMEEP